MYYTKQVSDTNIVNQIKINSIDRHRWTIGKLIIHFQIHVKTHVSHNKSFNIPVSICLAIFDHIY